MATRDEYSLRDIYLRMELRLIASLKRNLARWHRETEKVGFKYEPWQITKLRNLALFRKANRKIIGYYQKEIEDTIEQVINMAYVEPEALGIVEHDKIISQVFPREGGVPLEATKVLPEESFFHTNDKRVEVLIEDMQKQTKDVNRMVINRMDSVMSGVLDEANHNLQQGAMTIQQATDMATKKYLEKGIDAVIYKEGSRRTVAAHFEMALRTAAMRAKLLADGKERDRTGNHLIVSTVHANCCPACLVWQGEVMIDDVFSSGSKEDGDYPLLSLAVEQHFLHPNCRHNIVTYRPGITRKPQALTKEEEEEALRRYNAEQVQRKLERQIREKKRVIAGSFDSDKAEQQLKMLQSALRSHIKRNPDLRRNYWRERNV